MLFNSNLLIKNIAIDLSNWFSKLKFLTNNFSDIKLTHWSLSATLIGILWHLPESNFRRSAKELNPWHAQRSHFQNYHHIDELVQERCKSSALAMELCLSCTNPLICPGGHWVKICVSVPYICTVGTLVGLLGKLSWTTVLKILQCKVG